MSVRVEHVVHAVLSESLRAQEEHYTVMCFERNYAHPVPRASPARHTTCVCALRCRALPPRVGRGQGLLRSTLGSHVVDFPFF